MFKNLGNWIHDRLTYYWGNDKYMDEAFEVRDEHGRVRKPHNYTGFNYLDSWIEYGDEGINGAEYLDK